MLAQTIDEIKNRSGVLDDPEIESVMVARGLHRIYGQDGTSADETPPQSSSATGDARPPVTVPVTVLERMQRYLNREADYLPVTIERAVELTERIVSNDDDEQVLAFLELLNGICAEFYSKDKDVEGLIMYATHHAYTKTIHFNAALAEFAGLDPNNADELRVLARKFGADASERTSDK